MSLFAEPEADRRADKPYRNGKDLADKPRGVKLIDLFGLTSEEIRSLYPSAYQWVLERVKPERDENYILILVRQRSTESFNFLDASIAPDHMLIAIALDDAYFLGVLSSRIHVAWALATGGCMGMGNDPRYNKSRCFETFPFPLSTNVSRASIRDLAEQIDAHRKRVLAQQDDLR